jgi:beta-lactamase superfamily II metal-dependent hydrolase
MTKFHFLNVKKGDCSIIEHASGHISVIDVCNARKEYKEESELGELLDRVLEKESSGNFNQKADPVNPIKYLNDFGINSIFRFVLTHPDMDHMDGIKDLFEIFSPINFYDTNNDKEIDFSEGSPYREEDWEFYKGIRNENPDEDPKRLTLYSGDDGKYRTKDWDGNRPGDAFYVLTPTSELVEEANEFEDYNDCSYVILYRSSGGDILLCGDANDKTWEHLIENHKDSITDIDLLIAPHHGRKSDRDYSFLNIVNPKMTLFGNAKSDHLAYQAWSYRDLPYITNNQADCVVVDTSNSNMSLFVTNDEFAKQENPNTYYSDDFQGWFLTNIK